MWLLFRTLASAISLFLIVFTIPLAFDVGGRECGLAFSLALAGFYFYYSLLRLLTPEDSRIRASIAWFTGSTQWLTILALLIWSMNKFSVDSEKGSWVERTFDYRRAKDPSIREWLFGRNGLVESITIGNWDKFLRWSTPVFQIAEGFCSLLVIQACGQITRWLVNRERGDTWMIILLGVSAGTFSSSIYFLWRVTTFPEIGNVDAILIGSAVTCAVFLASWGIISGRGNPVESSLLVCTILVRYTGLISLTSYSLPTLRSASIRSSPIINHQTISRRLQRSQVNQLYLHFHR
jgi:hypothetical protein